jgi:hypothetical protein
VILVKGILRWFTVLRLDSPWITFVFVVAFLLPQIRGVCCLEQRRVSKPIHCQFRFSADVTIKSFTFVSKKRFIWTSDVIDCDR